MKIAYRFQLKGGEGGRLSIKIYNIAVQLVAEIDDSAAGGVYESSCVDISGIAPGVYLYKASAGNYSFPMGQFGIAR